MALEQSNKLPVTGMGIRESINFAPYPGEQYELYDKANPSGAYIVVDRQFLIDVYNEISRALPWDNTREPFYNNEEA